MKRLLNILPILTICLFVNIGFAISQEGASLPSEQTWSDIQNSTNVNDDATRPSLRAAPPEGPSIGETPIGEVSLIALLLTGVFYFIIKNPKVRKEK